ncbi:ABC transporter ATP-binding protein [Streptococcus iniae]|uniref:ABC transporter ATP-binding protein n=1 Tax=Streptococcus iniae TaxID=1346 RepID=I6LL01_STRIN|nr:ABC transporter ATP-binding protein [Streptococcus iniae]AGM99313.1 ferrichrome ABC transporter, ATP-binding protein FhuC [Streptococcus iniae SF1]ADG63115.1 FtsA [Streptococcus iniae]AHY16248.1 iron ABC transporter ATP-binding protein [Streptococcus iniae]AHY18112.1 iron ABC transporter ATP-binding protein [Streptococcus iniae]AJG26400.1 iron ABC transporter ATP-binding protein [Streptococcus iniae]
MSTISAQNISVNYDQKPVLSELSLTLMTHKITTIIGANGCGKSTLLKALSRIIPLQKGSVLIDGQAIAQLPTKEVAKKIALLPQVQDITEGITVFELVSYGRYPHQGQFGRLTEADYAIIEWAMTATNINSLANDYVDNLSGGQKQRVWIAMALAQDTDTIFLDEPTTYLDMNHQLEILELLKKLNQEAHKTIIMVLHDLNLSSRYSDYLLAMENGKIAKEGPVQEVITSDLMASLFKIDAQLIEDPIHKCPIILTYQLL